MSPHVGDSVYTPEYIVDSNRRGSASQRTRLPPVSNRVGRSDGSAGRVPPRLTISWVEEISTPKSYISGQSPKGTKGSKACRVKGLIRLKDIHGPRISKFQGILLF